jgi:PTH1 family peptidyl-tRNA hydrolase
MAMPIKLIIGLANPGERYALTRHNAGAWFIQLLLGSDSLQADSKLHASILKKNHLLAIPSTYMNESGKAVQAIAHYYKIQAEEILIAHDEIDLPVGTIRLKESGGHGGHNGLRDIIRALGSEKFWRLRIGVGRPAHSSQVHDYVLSPIKSAQEQHTVQTALQRAEKIIPQLLLGDIQLAMNFLHTNQE